MKRCACCILLVASKYRGEERNVSYMDDISPIPVPAVSGDDGYSIGYTLEGTSAPVKHTTVVHSKAHRRANEERCSHGDRRNGYRGPSVYEGVLKPPGRVLRKFHRTNLFYFSKERGRGRGRGVNMLQLHVRYDM